MATYFGCYATIIRPY